MSYPAWAEGLGKYDSVSFWFSWAAQPGAWGSALCWELVLIARSQTLLQALNCKCSIGDPEGPLFWAVFSQQHPISNWLNFLCTELYNSSTPTFLWPSQIALIQPVHNQGYILIFLDRMHLLFTQVHFLFWQPGQVGGQYTTLRYTVHFYLDFWHSFLSFLNTTKFYQVFLSSTNNLL